MKKLTNPWSELQGYNCFGCAQQNSFGLKMKFIEDGEFVISEWLPSPEYQGFRNILHGGIQATLMDEIASWTVFVKADKAGVTYNLELKFKKPVYITKGPLKLKSRLVKSSLKTARVHVDLYDSEDQPCSEADADFFLISDGKLFEDLRFPGREAFYKKEKDEI